jgi:hypothetical protein
MTRIRKGPQRMKIFRSLAFIAAALLAGCGGGGGGNGSSAPVIASTAPPDGALTANGNNTATLTLHWPISKAAASNARTPKYVSPSSTQITVTVNSVNGGPVPSWVTPNPQTTALALGTNCTAAGLTETCTLPVLAPPGTVNYTFTVSDGTNPLATLTTNETLTQGVSNSLSVTLQGIDKTVTVTGSALGANIAISGGELLTVSAFDADGNLIVSPGSYNSPITLTDNDATGVTSLTVNAGAPSSTVVVSSPSDVVKLNYNGQAVNGFTISATGTGLTGSGTISSTVNDISFTGTTLDDAAHGGLNTDPNWGQQTLFYATTSGSQGISGAELGFTNAPYSKLFDVTPSAGCAGIASVSAGPSTSFTVTALGGTGVCSARLTEHGTGYPITSHTANIAGSATHDGTFWISVTSASIGVNGKQRH